jgi:hypothetical protein
MTPKDVLATLGTLSLDDKLQSQRAGICTAPGTGGRGFMSQYQLNYQPMEYGIRKNLWEEGYRHRNDRKQMGFKHTKLEWRNLTDYRYLQW